MNYKSCMRQLKQRIRLKNKKSGILSGISLVILLVLLAGCKQEPAGPQAQVLSPWPLPSEETMNNSARYTNSGYGFSLNYCEEEFLPSEDFEGAVVAFAGPLLMDYAHRISIFIVAERLADNKTLEDYIRMNKQAGERTLLNYETVSEYATTIDGVPATVLVFTFTTGISGEAVMYKDMFAALVKDGLVYAIKYDVPAEFHDEYLDCFNLAISTFRFD